MIKVDTERRNAIIGISLTSDRTPLRQVADTHRGLRLHVSSVAADLDSVSFLAISTISPVDMDRMNTNELHSVLTDGANCGYCQVYYIYIYDHCQSD